MLGIDSRLSKCGRYNTVENIVIFKINDCENRWKYVDLFSSDFDIRKALFKVNVHFLFSVSTHLLQAVKISKTSWRPF